MLYIFDRQIFHYFLAADFQVNPTESTAKSSEKLANQKLCNTVLILDALYHIDSLGTLLR